REVARAGGRVPEGARQGRRRQTRRTEPRQGQGREGPVTREEHALLAAIVADPADDAARLAYADWLDEHGRPERAEFIRAQVEADGACGLDCRRPGVGGFENCEFRRGFPDRLKCLSGSYHGDITYTPAALKLPRWAAAFPLTGLSLESPQADAWRALDGPHLA